jgi:ribonuclease HI
MTVKGGSPMRTALVIREMLRRASVFDILDNLVERTDMTLYLKLKCPQCGYEQFVGARICAVCVKAKQVVETVIELYTDGGCRLTRSDKLGAWAYIVLEDGVVVDSASGVQTDTTVNRMEYQALLEGLNVMGCIGLVGHDVKIISDSQLLINQVTGKWKVNDSTLQDLKRQVLRTGGITLHGCTVEFIWMGRDNEWTAKCDKMCNDEMNRYATENKQLQCGLTNDR